MGREKGKYSPVNLTLLTCMLMSNSKSSLSEIHVRSQWTHSLKGIEPTTFCTPPDALTTDLHVPGAGMLLRASYWQIYCLKENLSPAEISTEHKYLGLKFKVQGPKEPVGFRNEPSKVFLSNIPARRVMVRRAIY